MMKRPRIERALRKDVGRRWKMVLGEEFMMVYVKASRAVRSRGVWYVVGEL